MEAKKQSQNSSKSKDHKAGPCLQLSREFYLYWIHCNRCTEIYVLKRRRIYLLACHHVACDACTPCQPSITPNGAPTYSCPICGKIVRGRQLCNMLPPHLKQLFHPQPWLENLPTGQIVRFQQPHRQHFMQALEKRAVYIMRLLKNSQLFRALVRKKFEELQHLIMDRKRVARRLRQFIQQRKKTRKQRLRHQEFLRHQAANRQQARLPSPHPNQHPPPPPSLSDESNASALYSRRMMPGNLQPHRSAVLGRGYSYIPPTSPFMNGGQLPRRNSRTASPNITLNGIKSFVPKDSSSFIL